jgi:hypothetical protein
MLRLVPAALAAVLLIVPVAQAEPVALLDAPEAQDIALAGSEVIVPRTGPRGRLTVDAVSVTGGAPRRLLTASGPGKGWGASAFTSASPTRVAVQVFYDKPNVELGDAVQWRLYTGPIAGPLQLEYTARRKDWHPIDTAVDGDRVFVNEGKFTLFATRMRLFEPGAAPRVLGWANGVDAPIALADAHLAFAGSSRKGADAPIDHVFVADPLTGVRQLSMSVSDPGGIDVAADGRVVADYPNGLVSAGPGVPKATLPGSRSLFLPQFTGSAIAAVERTRSGAVRPSVLDPGATAPRPIGVLTSDIQTLDANEGGVAWIGNGCVLFAPAGSGRPSGPSAGPCPRAEVQLIGADEKLHGRAVRMVASCLAAPPSGCEGRATLRFRGSGGSAPFSVAAGHRKVFSIRLTRRAARLVRARVHSHDFAVLPLRFSVRDGRSPDAGSVVLIDRFS